MVSAACSKLIIDDNNYLQFQGDNPGTAGGERRLMTLIPRQSAYGSLGFCDTGIPEIPMDQWPDKIADLERNKATLKHIWADIGAPVWDQDGLGYCHCFSVVMAMYMELVGVQGIPLGKFLAPSSIGGPITGWRNQGAMVNEDMERAVSHGACTVDFGPMCSSRRSDFKEGWEDDAKKYRVLKWYDGRPRNLLQQGSLLLANKPSPNGLNYWGHSVCDMVLRDLNPRLPATNPDRYGVEFLNSWTASFGDNGWAVRSGSKKYADEFYAVVSMSHYAHAA